MISFEVVETGFGNVEYRGKGQSPRVIRLRPIKQEVPENVKRIREQWQKMKREKQNEKLILVQNLLG